MKNGQSVAAFESAFAEYVGARFAIALCNGTATLHTALVALGVKPGDRVAVPPLTMSATTIAVLQAGAIPVFVDVLPNAWVMNGVGQGDLGASAAIPVSLYGLSCPEWRKPERTIDDAAQTLRRHSGCAFTSYSFQASKILPLGEGGMLVTNDASLAERARSFSSLGYRMKPDQPRILPEVLKASDYERHHLPVSHNYRMSDLVAESGLMDLKMTSRRIWKRREAASRYMNVIQGCSWITPQYVPEGWTSDYWCFAFAVSDKSLWKPLVESMVGHGAEHPYGAWQLTYKEPAFRHLAPDGTCPIAEDLQPRLVQCQTNDLASAERNASALAKAIREVGGTQ